MLKLLNSSRSNIIINTNIAISNVSHNLTDNGKHLLHAPFLLNYYVQYIAIGGRGVVSWNNLRVGKRFNYSREPNGGDVVGETTKALIFQISELFDFWTNKRFFF